jgi:hypothetical protein
MSEKCSHIFSWLFLALFVSQFSYINFAPLLKASSLDNNSIESVQKDAHFDEGNACYNALDGTDECDIEETVEEEDSKLHSSANIQLRTECPQHIQPFIRIEIQQPTNDFFSPPEVVV